MTQAPQETFLAHLIELRDRLVRALVALALVFVPTFFFAAELYDLLAMPMMRTLPQGSKMIATGVITPFFIPMKIAMMVAFLVALPYILYQAWAFVAPGLYAHEKKLVVPLIFSSTLLFFLGMAFCYFVVFQTVFTFIAQFAPKSITVAPDIEAYFNFVLGMFIAFGVTFEVPVVVVVLVMTGVISVEKLREIRSFVIVGAFVVAAVVTPPDVISQLMLAVPLCLLYEAGIFVARFVEKRKPEVDAGAAP
ncbi:MAG: twin-arginine translocase subunit TatC [Burkholderiales bacterium]